MSSAKFRLYQSAICVSSRRELLPIKGLVVGVLGLKERENGEWFYTVAPDSKDNRTYECSEDELQPTERANPCADDRPYPLLRQALGSLFHQEVEKLDEALYLTAQCGPTATLLSEIESLEKGGEEAIGLFLGQAMDVYQDDVPPTDFLLALKTLIKLRSDS